MMRIFFPNFKEYGLCVLIFAAIGYPWIFMLTEINFWVFLYCFLLYTIILFIVLILGTMSIRIEKSFLLLKRTCFSPQKKILFQNIYGILLDYGYHNKYVWFLIEGGKKYYCVADLYIIQELMTVLPKSVFHIEIAHKRAVPKKHREFLLNINVLDKEHREKLS